jgi:hypothetical protein
MSTSNSAPNGGKNARETFKVLKVAFGVQVMGRTQVSE